ncbi:glycosyltransferase family 2 protein [Zhaonella formicivorans]|uniref:glycosyltransferase family 2 protein n=1 Tax=Zhaonella formicivorans TaxID=2528593 RepID=UPI001D11AB2C|nr:glycosyltransferase [Zhaonella formicivorans]
MPKVSVIMGVYNSKDTVKKAIQSILNQSYRDWEFIICDDGSNDGTWEILQNIAKNHSKIILLRNKKNIGLGASLNRCIMVASGEYLARQDADDVSIENRLEEEVNFLNIHKEVSVIGTYANLVNQNGNVWGEIKPPEIPTKNDWVKASSVIHATVLMRKQDIVDVGMYNEEAFRVEDYELWMRLVSKGYVIKTLPKILYKIRWDISDYSRRAFKYRLIEAKVRLNGYRKMGVCVKDYIYVFKPIILGLIPKNLMFLHHQRRFKKNGM